MKLDEFEQAAIQTLSDEGEDAIRAWAFKGLLEFDYNKQNFHTLGDHEIFVTLYKQHGSDRLSLDELYHVGTPAIQRGLQRAFVDLANQLATNGESVSSMTPDERRTKLFELAEHVERCEFIDGIKPLIASVADEAKAKEIYGDSASSAFARIFRMPSVLAAPEKLTPEQATTLKNHIIELSENSQCKESYLPPLVKTLEDLRAFDSADPAPLKLAYRLLQTAVTQHRAFLTELRARGPAQEMDDAEIEKRIADDSAIQRMLTTLQQGGSVDTEIFRGKIDSLVSWCEAHSTLAPQNFVGKYMPFIDALKIGSEAAKQFEISSQQARIR